MERISVIVPVYKVEAYLDRCVRSIVEQTYRDLEIILVDDGSPDSCGAMCDAWAQRDSRIRVIHKENGGSGDARNAGLDVASGDYVAMVDSDDYVAPQMYQYLINLMVPGVDIAECEYLETTTDTAPLDMGTEETVQNFTVNEAMRHHVSDRLFRQVIWNKLYRRQVIGDIRFPLGKRIDDEFWTYRVIANAEKLARTSCRLYAYRQRTESVMHETFSVERLQALDAKCQRLEFLKDYFPELLSIARINLWHSCLYMGQMSLRHMDGRMHKVVFQKLDNIRREYPLVHTDRRDLPMRQYLWAMLSDVSLLTTCWLRNALHIGM